MDVNNVNNTDPVYCFWTFANEFDRIVVCQKSFGSVADLMSHVSVEHINDSLPYFCFWVNCRRFVSEYRGSLLVHVRQHVENNPDYTFSDNSPTFPRTYRNGENGEIAQFGVRQIPTNFTSNFGLHNDGVVPLYNRLYNNRPLELQPGTIPPVYTNGNQNIHTNSRPFRMRNNRHRATNAASLVAYQQQIWQLYNNPTNEYIQWSDPDLQLNNYPVVTYDMNRRQEAETPPLNTEVAMLDTTLHSWLMRRFYW